MNTNKDNYSEDGRIINDFLQYREKVEEEKTKRKARWPKALIILLAFVFAVILLSFLSSHSFYKLVHGTETDANISNSLKSYEELFEREEKAHYSEINRLQKIEDEILEDIRQQKYEEAMIKAQMLVYTVNYSNETKESWDSKRNALIEKLEQYLDK